MGYTTGQQARKTEAPPVHEIRLGRIKAAIWKNDTASGARYNVTIVRNYNDGKEWKATTVFGRDDLPLVAKASDMAHTWILQQKPERKQGTQAATRTRRGPNQIEGTLPKRPQ